MVECCVGVGLSASFLPVDFRRYTEGHAALAQAAAEVEDEYPAESPGGEGAPGDDAAGGLERATIPHLAKMSPISSQPCINL